MQQSDYGQKHCFKGPDGSTPNALDSWVAMVCGRDHLVSEDLSVARNGLFGWFVWVLVFLGLRPAVRLQQLADLQEIGQALPGQTLYVELEVDQELYQEWLAFGMSIVREVLARSVNKHLSSILAERGRGRPELSIESIVSSDRVGRQASWALHRDRRVPNQTAPATNLLLITDTESLVDAKAIECHCISENATGTSVASTNIANEHSSQLLQRVGAVKLEMNRAKGNEAFTVILKKGPQGSSLKKLSPTTYRLDYLRDYESDGFIGEVKDAYHLHILHIAETHTTRSSQDWSRQLQEAGTIENIGLSTTPIAEQHTTHALVQVKGELLPAPDSFYDQVEYNLLADDLSHRLILSNQKHVSGHSHAWLISSKPMRLHEQGKRTREILPGQPFHLAPSMRILVRDGSQFATISGLPISLPYHPSSGWVYNDDRGTTSLLAPGKKLIFGRNPSADIHYSQVTTAHPIQNGIPQGPTPQYGRRRNAGALALSGGSIQVTIPSSQGREPSPGYLLSPMLVSEQAFASRTNITLSEKSSWLVLDMFLIQIYQPKERSHIEADGYDPNAPTVVSDNTSDGTIVPGQQQLGTERPITHELICMEREPIS